MFRGAACQFIYGTTSVPLALEVTKKKTAVPRFYECRVGACIVELLHELGGIVSKENVFGSKRDIYFVVSSVASLLVSPCFQTSSRLTAQVKGIFCFCEGAVDSAAFSATFAITVS